MKIAENQRRIAAGLFSELLPLARSERGLPGRIEARLRSDRRLGSRDRRLYRELIYTALRFLPWIERAPDSVEAAGWLAADAPATRAFRTELLRDWPSCPETVADKARVLAARWQTELPPLLPAWTRAECPAAWDPAEYEALHRRAPVWIRLRRADDEGPVLAELRDKGGTAARGPELPLAWRVAADADLTRTAAFAAGRFEVQDIGSQRILACAAAAGAIAPGQRWLDACAGAGGKSLQLAGLLGPQGRIEVDDIRPAALTELETRARRAGVAGQIRRKAGGGEASYDGVLIDAPCTGAGTWRRAPHLKASTQPADVTAAADRQLRLVRLLADQVRPGGHLVYATCSLCRRENEGVVTAFLQQGSGFRLCEARLLTPASHDGDGFFVATLRRES